MGSEVSVYARDTDLLKLAREIAIDLFDLETILDRNKINRSEFNRIKQDPRFQRLLDAEIQAWHAASNTHERTKLKAGMLLEEFLPEANARIHDPKESLAAKNELVKTLARIAGMGNERVDGTAAMGERFTVTINLGADKKLEFSNVVTPKVTEVIEGTAKEV